VVSGFPLLLIALVCIALCWIPLGYWAYYMLELVVSRGGDC